MKVINKLQSLPEKKKKIILWSAVIITALFLLGVYIRNIQKRIKDIEVDKIKEELQIPEFGL
ncbi:MAG: hypothetical protein ACE5J0_00720 [Candidatus Paceibacterales bacterium]